MDTTLYLIIALCVIIIIAPALRFLAGMCVMALLFCFSLPIVLLIFVIGFLVSYFAGDKIKTFFNSIDLGEDDLDDDEDLGFSSMKINSNGIFINNKPIKCDKCHKKAKIMRNNKRFCNDCFNKI